MQGRKAHHRFFAPAASAGESSPSETNELEESDVWGYDTGGSCGGGPLTLPSGQSAALTESRGVKKGGDRRSNTAASAEASSLPMSIPERSKILGSSFGESRRAAEEWAGYYDDEEARGQPVVPPHELLCRSRAASFSVHEGLGRTLKGRDLSRLRNAIWAKTGFQD